MCSMLSIEEVDKIITLQAEFLFCRNAKPVAENEQSFFVYLSLKLFFLDLFQTNCKNWYLCPIEDPICLYEQN